MKRILLSFIALSFAAYADEAVISIDRAVPGSFELAFPNEQNIQSEPSDFKINNFVLMSNKSGERWAVVTVTNQAAGRRSLSQKHVMALVADGRRIAPLEFLQSFRANETLSVTIDFGESKFPLLSVYSRTDT